MAIFAVSAAERYWP